MSSFCGMVYKAAGRIPSGRVATYRAVAEDAGNPKAYRAAGNALSKNKDAHVPCRPVLCVPMGILADTHGGVRKRKNSFGRKGSFSLQQDALRKILSR